MERSLTFPFIVQPSAQVCSSSGNVIRCRHYFLLAICVRHWGVTGAPTIQFSRKQITRSCCTWMRNMSFIHSFSIADIFPWSFHCMFGGVNVCTNIKWIVIYLVGVKPPKYKSAGGVTRLQGFTTWGLWICTKLHWLMMDWLTPNIL